MNYYLIAALLLISCFYMTSASGKVFNTVNTYKLVFSIDFCCYGNFLVD